MNANRFTSAAMPSAPSDTWGSGSYQSAGMSHMPGVGVGLVGPGLNGSGLDPAQVALLQHCLERGRVIAGEIMSIRNALSTASDLAAGQTIESWQGSAATAYRAALNHLVNTGGALLSSFDVKHAALNAACYAITNELLRARAMAVMCVAPAG